MTTPTIDPSLLLAQRDWLRRLALRLVADPGAADDLVQETWMTALEGRRPPASTSRAWLAGVLRNKALSRRRAERRRARREGDVARPEARDEDPGGHLAAVELGQELTARVLALSPPLRDAVVLRYFHDRSTASIAAELGVPESTIRTRLARAVAKLREELDADSAGRERWCSALIALAGPPAREASAVGAGSWVAAGLVAVSVAGILALRDREGLGGEQALTRSVAPPAVAEGAVEPLPHGPASHGRPTEARVDANEPPAPAQPAAASTAPRGQRNVSGRVVGSDVERPGRIDVFFAYLAGGTVRTVDARVDAYGEFTLETTQDAAGRLVAVGAGMRPASLDLARGESRAGVQLVLDPGATISGTVAGGRVALRATRVTEHPTFGRRFGGPLVWGEERIESAAASTVADAEGRFELAGLEPGAHEVLVQPIHGPSSQTGQPIGAERPERMKYRSFPYVDLPLPAEAAQVLVAPASGVELRLASRAVAVRVLDGGRPMEQFYCEVGSERPPRRMTRGELHIRCHPDHPGSLRLWFPDFAERVLRFPEDLPPDGELVVELERTSPPIEMRLRLSGAVPDRVAVEVRESRRGGPPFLILRELDVTGGEVRVDGLFPGPVLLRVGPVPEADAPSFLLEHEQEIVVERDPAPREVSLARGGRVELFVHRSTPGTVPVLATAIPPDGWGVPLRVGSSNWKDGDRLQHAEALAPGRYELTFQPAIERGQALPEALSFEILEGEVTRLDVRFPAE